MNTKQAAKEWGKSQSTVSQWCREGWIESAVKNKDNQWVIDDNALAPLKVSKNKQKEYSQRITLILKALSRRQTIPVSKFIGNKSYLKEHFNELLINGFIREIESDNDDLFSQYFLTIEGNKLLNNKKALKVFLEEISPLVTAVSTAAFKNIL